MPVQGLAGDAEFGAKIADFRIGPAHRCQGETKLGGGHLVGTSAVAATCPCRGQSGEGAFRDEFTFEFSQGGENSEDELSGGGGGVDGGALPGEYFEPDATVG
jgi:hypothetical protein